jgi:hypothetical protein
MPELDIVHLIRSNDMTLRKTAPRAKERWLTLSFAVAAATLLVASLVSANLVGSNFNAGDGNLVGDGTANSDWCARTQADLTANFGGVCPTADEVTGLNKFEDLPSGTGDNSLGQGAKEDKPCPTVVSGSIPPNKSDLTRFYVASETGANGHFYLYLAWERTNILGNANMDFEFNQSKTACSNSSLPTRTADDLLVTYDFVNGGGNPVIGIRTWTGSAWSAATTLDPSEAEAKVNEVTVSDPLDPHAPRSLSQLTFGEAALDLTEADIIAEGECAPFASVYLKSRSAAAFTAELKDFIAPHATTLSNCGALAISKTSSKDDSGLQGATFSIQDPDGNDLAGSPFTTDANGEICITALAPGDYTVTETGAPDGYAIDDPTDRTVTVGTSGDCDTTAAEVFTDSPLTEIEVKVTSLAGEGVTNSSIVCEDEPPAAVDAVEENGDDDPAFDDTDEVFTDLPAGTYTCTIVVDP